MIKTRKILAGLLAAVTAISFAACEEEAPLTSNAGTTSGNSAPADITAGSGEETKKEIEKPTSTPVINYLGFYNPIEAGDIIPAWEYYKETYGFNGEAEFNYIKNSYGTMREKLSALISSDDAPDLIDKMSDTYPLWISNNMFEPLDDYIDLTSEEWAPVAPYVENYSWNGKHYLYPWSVEAAPDMLIYNRTIFQQEGITEPLELYRSGDWNWNTMKDILVQFTSNRSDRVGIYGSGVTTQFFMNTTGVAILGKSADGKMQNNLTDLNIDRAAAFVEQLRKEGLTKQFISADVTQDVEQSYLNNGDAAFHSGGKWLITGYFKNYDNEFFAVPFPKDPESDTYYMRGLAFGYLVPRGAKNVQNAVNFISSNRMARYDDALKEKVFASTMDEKGYSQEMSDFLMEFYTVENYNLVIDEPFGFDADVNTALTGILDKIAFDQSQEQTWNQMKMEVSDIFSTVIDSYNDKME